MEQRKMLFDPRQEKQYREVILKRLDFYSAHFIHQEVFNNIDIEFVQLVDVEGMMIKLRTFLYGEDIHNQTWDYPATWWDAVKNRWLPTWFRRKFPKSVKYHRISVDVKAMYPKLSLQYPKSETIIIPTFTGPTDMWFNPEGEGKMEELNG